MSGSTIVVVCVTVTRSIANTTHSTLEQRVDDPLQ